MKSIVLTAVAVLTVPTFAVAQIRASERSTLTQTVDGTVITLDYARPRLRGRSQVFGTQVKWNEVWTPGANWATTLEASKPITLDGHPIPKGKYSVWLVVRQSGPWTLVLDPDHRRYHEDPPDSNAAQVRIPVVPVAAPKTDVLTFFFPEIRVNGGTLAMQWAETRISVEFRVEPSYAIATPEDVAAAYVGRYHFIWKPVKGFRPDTLELVITYEKGSLYGTFVPHDPYWGKFVLIRLADGELMPGVFRNGELYEVYRDFAFGFKGPKARPDVLEVRDDDDTVVATGTRKG
jgi:Protein of unknown function (DUF2911)